MRVERIGDATLYLGDCREVLPTIEAQVLVTDPVWPAQAQLEPRLFAEPVTSVRPSMFDPASLSQQGREQAA